MISVAIITKNEEKNIRRTLESLTWADEIIVVDANSADRTPEICREYTEMVYSREWPGFAEQKEKAVSLATGEWVLVLDADEVVTEHLRDEIREVVSCEPPVNGYYIPRKNYFGDRWVRFAGWWPDYTLRLFRRGTGSFLKRQVHESITVHGATGRLRSPLEHYTYKNINDYLRRMKIYSNLAAKELNKEGRTAHISDLIIRPAATFLKMFFLQLGFLHGLFGLRLSYLYSMYTYNKYAKLRKIART